MKIHLEDDENLEVVVPSKFNTSVEIWVEDDRGADIIEVAIKDGLIGAVREKVVRRNLGTLAEDRLVLWGHIISKHAACVGLDMPIEDLIALHEHEHNGPGTIRNHPRESREYSLKKIGEVLSESET